MKKIFASFLALALSTSCNKKDSTATKITIPDSLITTEDAGFNIKSIPENCYLQVVGKDSTFVQLTDNLGTYSGEMRIKNNEKDSSKGELSGFKNGDTLKLSYIFESEGIISERPIYFLKKGANLIPGIGDYEQIKSIKFENENTFNPIECNLIKNQLK